MPQLYPFQEECVSKLVERRSVLIGDDMGLGKTAEAIALDVRRRVLQPTILPKLRTLVITYIAVIPAWIKQYKTWAPHLKVTAINPKNRQDFLDDLFLDEHDVYICHPQAIRLIEDELKASKWFHLIYDEVHWMQNRKAKQTVAAKKLKAEYKTGLSGTPAYDKPDDLWSVLNWLYPDYWSSYWRFYDNHIVSVDYTGYKVTIGVKNEQVLQKEMESFYIRRLKEDVLPDLPDKYFSTITVQPDPKQFRAYESMRKEMLAWVGDKEETPLAATEVIAQLIRLQQFSDAFAEVDDDNKVHLSEPSSKLDALMEILESTNEQIVVFSQFSQMIKLLGARLEKAKISHGLYTGDTSPDERARIIDDFQARKLRVFAGTIQAGGTGITLTSASTVVFLDRTWSGATNNQAIDRLHRIGQKNAVHVIDIVCDKTLDVRRLKDIELKWSMIKFLLGEGKMIDGEEMFSDEDD